jgi:hypothetical protein
VVLNRGYLNWTTAAMSHVSLSVVTAPLSWGLYGLQKDESEIWGENRHRAFDQPVKTFGKRRSMTTWNERWPDAVISLSFLPATLTIRI